MLVKVRLVDDSNMKRRMMLVEVSGRRESDTDAITRAEGIALRTAGTGWWLTLTEPCRGKNAVIFDTHEGDR